MVKVWLTFSALTVGVFAAIPLAQMQSALVVAGFVMFLVWLAVTCVLALNEPQDVSDGS